MAQNEQVKKMLATGASPLGDPGAARVALNKARTEDWLRVVGAADKTSGRGEHNWQRPPRRCLTQVMIDALHARGIAIYTTGGQFIAADLTGENPRIRQRRPLAERYIELMDPCA